MARVGKNGVSSRNDDLGEEMTVIVVKVKGQGDTLRKGFEAISSAFSALSPSSAVTRRSSSPQTKQLNGSSATEEVDVDEVADEDTEDPITIDGDSPSAPSAAKPAQRSKPKFLTEFDLNAGTVSWKDFANSRSPNGDYENYLLAALWLTEEAKVAEFTTNHIFTCIRAMKWKEQVDFSQPLRQMKSKKSYFSRPTTRTWKLTQPGFDAAQSIKQAGVS